MCGQGLFLGGGEGGHPSPFVRISPSLKFVNTVRGVGARLLMPFQDNFRPLLTVGYIHECVRICSWIHVSGAVTCLPVNKYCDMFKKHCSSGEYQSYKTKSGMESLLSRLPFLTIIWPMVFFKLLTHIALYRKGKEALEIQPVRAYWLHSASVTTFTSSRWGICS